MTLDTRLAAQPFIAGPQATIADIAMYGEVCQLLPNFAALMDITPHQHLSDWYVNGGLWPVRHRDVSGVDLNDHVLGTLQNFRIIRRWEMITNEHIGPRIKVFRAKRVEFKHMAGIGSAGLCSRGSVGVERGVDYTYCFDHAM